MNTTNSPRYILAAKHIGFIEKATEKVLLNRSEETIHRILFHTNRFKEDFADIADSFKAQIQSIEKQLLPKKPFELIDDTSYNNQIVKPGRTITTDEGLYELKEIRFYIDNSIKFLLEDPFGEEKEIDKSDLEALDSLGELDTLMESEKQINNLANELIDATKPAQETPSSTKESTNELLLGSSEKPLQTRQAPKQETDSSSSTAEAKKDTDINSLIDSLMNESANHPRPLNESNIYDPLPRNKLLTEEIPKTTEKLFNNIEILLEKSFPQTLGTYEVWEHIKHLDPKRAIKFQSKDGTETSVFIDAYTFLHPTEFNMKSNPETAPFIENIIKVSKETGIMPEKGESVVAFVEKLFR